MFSPLPYDSSIVARYCDYRLSDFASKSEKPSTQTFYVHQVVTIRPVPSLVLLKNSNTRCRTPGRQKKQDK